MKTMQFMGCCAIVALSVGLHANVVVGQEGEIPTDELFGPAPALHETPAPSPPCRCLGEAGAAVARIKEVLAAPLKSTGLDFHELPLEELVAFLQDEYEIPIQMDAPALEDAGLSPDEQVSLSIQNVSLRSALRLLLRHLQLTYTIQNEVLLITTPEVAEAQLVTCIYDVRDLVGVHQSSKDIQALIQAIYACIAADTWAAKGGGAPAISSLRRGVLIVSQTRAVHDEIAELLEAVRQVPHDPREPTLADAARAGSGTAPDGHGMGGHGYGRGYGEMGRGGYGMRGYGDGEPASAGGEFDE